MAWTDHVKALTECLGRKPTLNELLAEAKNYTMTPEEVQAQRDSWVQAEMSWPKSKYKWVNGVKVYDSYEDYIND